MNNMTKYIDKHGRWHIKPVTEENPYPTNNAYIYSFYAEMVGLPVVFDGKVSEDLLFLRKKPLSRHPGIVPPETPPISHDEYVGVAGMSSDYNGRADRIIDFGKANHWQFCDIPGFTPTPFRKLVINDVIASYEDLANEENPRRAVIKYPNIYPIAFWHRPEQQYFYYRCAGKSPGIIRTLYFIFATLVSIFKREKSSPMLGFKMLKFKKLGPTLIEKALIKLYDKYGNFKERCQAYFPEDHPILKEIL